MSKGLKSPSIVLAALLMAGTLLSFGCKEDKKAASKPGTLAKIVVADAKTTQAQ